MSVKGTVLESYQFDVRDFSDRQIQVIKAACAAGKGNTELKRKLHLSIARQEHNRKKYVKKVALERRKAYMKPVYDNLREKLHIPIRVWNFFGDARRRIDNFSQSLLPKSWSLYGQDTMEWPEIHIDEDAGHSPHVLAGMPANCVKLPGWERVKQAFLPRIYMEMYDPYNPTHTFNWDTLTLSTFILSCVVGVFHGAEYANRDLAKYKEHEGTVFYESRMMGQRVRDAVYARSLAKYAIRWGWRFGLLYAVTYGISQSMTIYRLEDKVGHYVAATGIATALYAWKSGPSGMMRFGIVGAILGIPLGICFATLGFNPRPLHYYSKVEPYATGPMSQEGMTLQERLLSTERTFETLFLLRTSHSPEINNEEFFRKFVGST
uniref:uncharacterized protein LOC120331737 n=1 Tax=Styela clava TaxID=7725 RepID=UPI00193A8853|nr:uncharacterized protein LOC120331737 [Styela clava]XP_039254811.1 uncharacterized protein LOC120331737 [Styela clava]